MDLAMLKENDELDLLYKLYGIASHNCSNIEYRIAFLLLGPKWNLIEDLNPEEVTKVYEELYKKPLGALLKLYKQHYEFSDKTVEQMDMLLEKRNYLVHRFFGTYGRKMHDPKIIIEMTEELKKMIYIFQEASHSLDPANWDQV
jgi:hypothetical protein